MACRPSPGYWPSARRSLAIIATGCVSAIRHMSTAPNFVLNSCLLQHQPSILGQISSLSPIIEPLHFMNPISKSVPVRVCLLYDVTGFLYAYDATRACGGEIKVAGLSHKSSASTLFPMPYPAHGDSNSTYHRGGNKRRCHEWCLPNVLENLGDEHKAET